MGSEVLPHFGERKYNCIFFEDRKWEDLDSGEYILCFLGDEDLKEVLDSAVEKEWEMGVLPHPKLIYGAVALKINTGLKEVLNEVFSNDHKRNCDLFYCNELLVFKSVRMGKFTAMDSIETKDSKLTQAYGIFNKIRSLWNATHDQVKIEAGDDFTINTSALGVLAIDHAESSIMANKLVGFTQGKDQKLHILIVSPESLLEMLGFLVNNIMPFSGRKMKRPDFIGHIKCDNAVISEITKKGVILDGREIQEDSIALEIKAGAVTLLQKNAQEEIEESPETKNQFKVNGMPQGEKRDTLIKRPLPFLPRASTDDFKELFTVLRHNSELRTPYTVMMIIATILATFGLYGNSGPVIIGAMILTPLMSPIVSFSMGLIRFDVSMFVSSLRTILAGTFVAILFATLVSLIIPMKVITPEIDARLTPNLLDLGIAVASGIAGAYAHAKEEIAKTLAGVAIAVALIPPLAVAGIGIGWMDWSIFSGAFLLFLTNLAGIVLFGGFTFILLGFAPFKRAKKGLIFTSIVTVLLAIPLAISFNQIATEAAITKSLEGAVISELTIRDVRVRQGEGLAIISLRLAGSSSISDEEIEEVKREIEKKINQEVRLEVTTSLEL